MRRHYDSYYDRNRFYMTDELKHRLNTAFAAFRAVGLVARQNFSCCGGCAGYELATHVGEKVKKDERNRSKIKGVVSYNRQDTERLNESGSVWLSYGQVDSTEVGPVGLPTVQVGRMIVEVLEALSIPYEWDGDGDTRIKVCLHLYGKPMSLACVG